MIVRYRRRDEGGWFAGRWDHDLQRSETVQSLFILSVNGSNEQDEETDHRKGIFRKFLGSDTRFAPRDVLHVNFEQHFEIECVVRLGEEMLRRDADG